MRYPGFIGPSYTSQSVNVDCQRTVNMYPEINALGTGKDGEVASLVSTPGLALLLTLPYDRIRCVFTASTGVLFIVANAKLYQISSSWVATELGTLLTDTGRVSMADNGDDVCLVDGAFGYTYKISTLTFAQITAPAFYPADQVAYQDGYFIFNKTGTQQFFISGINAVTFNALDVASAEGSPDNLVGVCSNNQNVFLFGSKSVEVFYNTGDAAFPFSRINGAVMDVGVTATFSIARMVGSIFFLGGDNNGTGIVYEITGMQYKRISTPAIESVIRTLTTAQIASSTSWTYQQGGHLFYCLNLTGLNTTFVYDGSTGFWHERCFLNLWSTERHRASICAVAYGKYVVGDYQNGKVYSLDQLVYTDNGTPIVRIRTAPHTSNNLKYARHKSFKLDIETGVGLDGTGQGTDPLIALSWSDDGGHTWSNEHFANIGKIGETKKRVGWYRLGSARDRVYQVKISEPVKVVLIGADLDVVGNAY